MPFRQILVITLALVAAGASRSQTQAEFDLAGPPTEVGAKLQLWATHYFVHVAVSSPSGLPFKNKSGKALSDTVQPRDWCLAAIEGTVQVTLQGSIRTLNFGGAGSQSQVDCAAVLKIDPAKKPWIGSTGKSYFVPAIGPFGDGVGGYKLVPYRTVAVDKSMLPYGTVIFIPGASGLEVKLPSGGTFKHDGYFFAADTGGAIKGNHIDVFCGATSTNCLPGVVASDPTKTFEALLVKDAVVLEALRSRHK